MMIPFSCPGSCFTINIEPLPGISIDEAAKDAVLIANHLKVSVGFKLNGICIIVNPDDNYRQVIQKYHERRKGN